MNTYFFDPKKFGSLYNCTNFPFNIVPLEQRRKPLLGSIYLLLGILLELLYLPCMVAIWRHLDQACYKVMFFIACADVCCLPIIGILQHP